MEQKTYTRLEFRATAGDPEREGHYLMDCGQAVFRTELGHLPRSFHFTGMRRAANNLPVDDFIAERRAEAAREDLD